jgi:DNA polymerase zeta
MLYYFASLSRAVAQEGRKSVRRLRLQVYIGSILQTKKRYVGDMYEDVRDTRPVLDVKGIELVRRDSCPAVAKILETSLTTLFRTRNLSAVREFCQRQFTRILANRVSVRDFMFAREVRLGSYRLATVPPAAWVAAKRMAQDPRLEPAHGERVRINAALQSWRF